MKKIFTLIAALTLSAGLWATSIWSGSQDVHWDNPIKIDASKFASALPGNKITISIWVNDGTNDEIEFKANGQKLPGTRFSLCQDWWETYDLFMTQDMIDSCKVYGMEICGDNFNVTNVDLSEGKAASMKEGKTIWTGYFWVDSWHTLEVFKEALTAVKDWDKYKTMRFYSECPTTDNLIFLLADWTEAGEIAKSEPATDEIAGNPLKRYEGYAELDLTKVNPLTFINNVASDRLMMMMDKQGSAGFNFTDVVLVEQTAPPATELFVAANASVDHTWGQFENPEATWNDVTGTFTIEIKAQSEWQWGNQVFLATGITTLDVTKEYQVSFDIVASTADCSAVTFKAFDDNQIAMASQNISVTDVVQTWTSEWTKASAATANGLMVWDFGCDPVQTVTITNISVKERDAQAPASGPTVDETGITVNGRKYGFPVRLVKEVK